MSALEKHSAMTAKIYYLHEYINLEDTANKWLIVHARRAFRFQCLEANAQVEADRLGYCVTCHRYHTVDDDDGA